MKKYLFYIVFFAFSLFVFHDYYLDQDCLMYKDKKECTLFQKCDIDKDGCLDHTFFHIMISTIQIPYMIFFHIEYFSSYTFRDFELSTYMYPIYKPPIYIS